MKKIVAIFCLVFVLCVAAFVPIVKAMDARKTTLENNQLSETHRIVEKAISCISQIHKMQFLNEKMSKEVSNCTSRTVQAELNSRLDCIKDMARRIDIQFVDANITTKIHSIALKAEYEVNYTETTMLTYRYYDSDILDVMGFASDHKMTISSEGIVLSDEFDESFSTGYSNCSLSTIHKYKGFEMDDNIANDECGTTNSSTTVETTTFNYNSSGAVAYSDTYALTNNPNYPVVSNDCADFVSQCLHTGGGIPFMGTQYSTGWYINFNTQPAQHSKCWINAKSFVDFWKGQGITAKRANGNNSNMANCIPGNPVYWLNPAGSSSSGHIMICAGHNQHAIPYINAHNAKVYHMPITNYSQQTLYTLQIAKCSHNTNKSYHQLNDANHACECDGCHNMLIEAHIWQEYPSYVVCTHCGRIIYKY